MYQKAHAQRNKLNHTEGEGERDWERSQSGLNVPENRDHTVRPAESCSDSIYLPLWLTVPPGPAPALLPSAPAQAWSENLGPEDGRGGSSYSAVDPMVPGGLAQQDPFPRGPGGLCFLRAGP